MMNYTDAINKLDEFARSIVDTHAEDDIEAINKLKEITDIRNCLNSCRNELCLFCNKYKLDDCGDCRWGM